MKFRVSITHRLIGGDQEFDTSTTVEARSFDEAIKEMEVYGLRQGHEITSVSAYLVEDEKGGDSGNA